MALKKNVMTNSASTRMDLTLGPLLFNWPSAKIADFYARIADEAPIDLVCLGEVVCSKRSPFHATVLADASERLRRAGKRVALSTLGLITLRRERHECAELSKQSDYALEVNDLTGLAFLEEGTPFHVGPLVNVYNESTMEYLAARGATHFCLPPELSLAAIGILSRRAAELGVIPEVWGFGRTPLAISGRCYHARLEGLSKDSCQFVCERSSDGLDVRTIDDQMFLAVNGVQTLSHTYCNVILDTESLAQSGVRSLRLSPHSFDMVAVAEAFRARLDNRIDAGEAYAQIAAVCGPATFSNGFLTGSAGHELVIH